MRRRVVSKKEEMQVYGFNSVASLCEYKKEDILRLYFTKERAKNFGSICKYLASKRRFYKMVEDESELEKLSLSHHHQGVVAIIKEPEVPIVNEDVVDEWVRNEKDVLFTDSVGNSQNLGAIVRSMAFFGVENIVLASGEAQSYITPSTYRVAEGGMSFVNVYLCSSIREFIKMVRGKMKIITSDVRSHHDVSKLASFVQKDDAVLLVMGNECDGVSEYVKKSSDHIVKIKGVGNIESLNVAQTASIFLQKLKEIK